MAAATSAPAVSIDFGTGCAVRREDAADGIPRGRLARSGRFGTRRFSSLTRLRRSEVLVGFHPIAGSWRHWQGGAGPISQTTPTENTTIMRAIISSLAASALLAAGASLRAADTSSSDTATPRPVLAADGINLNPEQPKCDLGLYQSNEFSVEGFGVASLGQYTIEHWSGQRIRKNAEYGAGLGLDYFFCRHLGIGADVYSENTSGVFIDSASANLIMRLPLGHSGLAPYIFGGGGHQFDMIKASFGQGGVGLEYRFTRHIGIFLDARGVVPDEGKSYAVGRLGVRFAF